MSGRGRACPEPHPDSPPEPKPAEGTTAGDPIAPTEFPRERSAAKTLRAREGTPVRCDMRLQRGGYRPPITPGGGYRLEHAPNYLTSSDGQRPTVHRPQRRPPPQATRGPRAPNAPTAAPNLAREPGSRRRPAPRATDPTRAETDGAFRGRPSQACPRPRRHSHSAHG